jgi:hypothetical protein
MLSSHQKEELLPTDPEVHYQISKSTRYHLNLAKYAEENEDDMALKACFSKIHVDADFS